VAAAANAYDLMMWFSSRTFIAGDLAFFAVILGKENMSGSWCNWCKLSPKGWSKFGHEKGELWSIEKINNICDSVENGTLAETTANLKGCTMRPLIDAVAVETFILSILHILIGMGNVLIESYLEWIEERVEKLTLAEVEARNRIIYATIQLKQAEEVLERFLQNDGILLSDKQLDKQVLKWMLHE